MRALSPNPGIIEAGCLKEKKNMHRILVITLALVLLCSAAALQAQEPATQAAPPAALSATKVGWVDLEQVIMRCEEGKKELADLQALVEKRTGEMRGLQQEGQFLTDQIRVQGDKLRIEAREELQAQIESKNLQLQRFQEDSQKEVDNRRARITNTMTKKVVPVIEKIAREKGLSFVMYINPTIAAYIDPASVITDEVVAAYNAAHPPAAAPQAAPAKKP